MPAAKLMPGFDAHVADVAGVRTRFFVGGRGPSLVLIHGLGSSATAWTELAPLLARRRRVLVPDLPGHGRSAPLPEVRGIESYADHVALLAERVAMLPAAVVGHSLGGVVALRVALRRPDGVSALALVAAAGITPSPRRDELALRAFARIAPWRVVVGYRDAIARRPRLRRAVFGYHGGDPTAISPLAALGFLEGAAHRTDVPSARRALFRDDPRFDLHDVRCPTVLVWGARDRLVPLAAGFEYARRLRAPIRAVPAAGHLVIGERPRECAAILEQFFDRVGLDGVGEVDELPLEAEALGELRREGADA